ncbi:hypothetical protein HZC20_01895 [Candidatus Peregrinibacteria bacterium]|nr:hypothetical protein [Candidatus Peregrinibacteria bacterium]
MEKPIYPQTKTRLVFSFVAIVVGLFIGYALEEFDGQLALGWIIVGFGVAGVVYNIYCLKTGRKY